MWDETIQDDDDDSNWANTCAPSGERSHPCDRNVNDDGESEEAMQGWETGTGKGNRSKDGNGKGKATEDRKGKGNGKGKGKGKWKGIVKNTPGGHDISRAVALKLPNEMSYADFDTEV